LTGHPASSAAIKLLATAATRRVWDMGFRPPYRMNAWWPFDFQRLGVRKRLAAPANKSEAPVKGGLSCASDLGG
jgi:hypothetical protein